jgi:glycosyltransferase involved in cell wall biosynthesis
MGARRVLFVVTADWYFCSHRLPLARAALARGDVVGVATSIDQHGEAIAKAGIEAIDVSFRRRGVRPDRELGVLRELRAAMRRFRPDLVHNISMKPVIYGTLAARMEKVGAIVNTLTGLGYVFSSRDAMARMLRPLVEAGLRRVLATPRQHLVVQNPDDQRLLEADGIVPAGAMTLIRGSGVNTDAFSVRPEAQGEPLVVFPARMLKQKGVGEMVAAARLLRDRGVKVRVALVGTPDPDNPSSVTEAQLKAWHAEGAVEWWGYRADMAEVLRQAHIVCLPSTYGEGVPKCLLEAAASGRAIVATDIPGCREAVRHGENGLLVPPRDPAALAEALESLLADAARRREMGERGRRLAVEEFSEQRVVAETLALYERLAPCASR